MIIAEVWTSGVIENEPAVREKQILILSYGVHHTVFQRFAHQPSVVLPDMHSSLVAKLNADPVWFVHTMRIT
jgi:hypothetical protein